MATKRLARYAMGAPGGGGVGPGAALASAVSASVLCSSGVPTCTGQPRLKGLCLDLSLEPLAALCASVEGPRLSTLCP